jgi:hypothetical protein
MIPPWSGGWKPLFMERRRVRATRAPIEQARADATAETVAGGHAAGTSSAVSTRPDLHERFLAICAREDAAYRAHVERLKARPARPVSLPGRRPEPEPEAS